MGPPASVGLNSLNLRPYVSVRPFRQNGRCGHSGGPARMSVLAMVAPPEAPADAAPDGLLPPHLHAPRDSASTTAPSAALRKLRMAPPQALAPPPLGRRRQGPAPI